MASYASGYWAKLQQDSRCPDDRVSRTHPKNIWSNSTVLQTAGKQLWLMDLSGLLLFRMGWLCSMKAVHSQQCSKADLQDGCFESQGPAHTFRLWVREDGEHWSKLDSEVFPYCLDLFRAQCVVRSNCGKMRQAEKIMDVWGQCLYIHKGGCYLKGKVCRIEEYPLKSFPPW